MILITVSIGEASVKLIWTLSGCNTDEPEEELEEHVPFASFLLRKLG
jgi:hypothetical protein